MLHHMSWFAVGIALFLHLLNLIFCLVERIEVILKQNMEVRFSSWFLVF
jgi:hypothetical protein